MSRTEVAECMEPSRPSKWRQKQRCWKFTVKGVSHQVSQDQLLADVLGRYTTVIELTVLGGSEGPSDYISVKIQFKGPQPSEGPAALLLDLLHGTDVVAEPVDLPRGRKKRQRRNSSLDASDSDPDNEAASTNPVGYVPERNGKPLMARPKEELLHKWTEGQHNIKQHSKFKGDEDKHTPFLSSMLANRNGSPAHHGGTHMNQGYVHQSPKLQIPELMPTPVEKVKMPSVVVTKEGHISHDKGDGGPENGGVVEDDTGWDDLMEHVSENHQFPSSHPVPLDVLLLSSTGSSSNLIVKEEPEAQSGDVIGGEVGGVGNGSCGPMVGNTQGKPTSGGPAPTTLPMSLSSAALHQAHFLRANESLRSRGLTAVVAGCNLRGVLDGRTGSVEFDGRRGVGGSLGIAGTGVSVTGRTSGDDPDAGAGRQERLRQGLRGSKSPPRQWDVAVEVSPKTCDFEGQPNSGMMDLGRVACLLFKGLDVEQPDRINSTVTAMFGVDGAHCVGKVAGPLQSMPGGNSKVDLQFPSMLEIWSDIYRASNVRVVEVDVVIEVSCESGGQQWSGPHLKVTYQRSEFGLEVEEGGLEEAVLSSVRVDNQSEGTKGVVGQGTPMDDDESMEESYSCGSLSCNNWLSDMFTSVSSVFSAGACGGQQFLDDEDDAMVAAMHS